MNMKKLPNGRWQVRWRDETGKQRARNFRSKEVAQVELRDLIAGRSRLLLARETGETFVQFAERWHRDYCKVEKAEIQWVDDWSVIKNHLLPAFGGKALPALAKADLLQLRGRLKSEGRLRVKTVNNITALAKTMLETAVDWELLPANPWAGVKLLPRAEQAFTFWSEAERDRFIAVARRLDSAFADAVEFACHTGLRIGELAALRRDAVDFDRRAARVMRSFCVKLGQTFERTKSRRIREVPLNEAAWRLVADKRLLPPKALLFEIDPSHASRRLRQLAEMAQVTPLRFHDLRHTFASHLAMAGVPVQKIQALLGHADIKQTTRYAHLHPEALMGTTDCLTRLTGETGARNVHAQGISSGSH